MKFKNLLRVLALSTPLFTPLVFANNVGGVYGPVIKPGDKSFQFRAATSPKEQGGKKQTVMRGHYQQAIGETLRWRIVGQVRNVDGSYEYDNMAAELLWQFQHREQDTWDSAVRFDFRTRKGNRPENVALNWTNQWTISNKWSATALATLSWQFGSDLAASGTHFETRARLAYKTGSALTLGFDSFNSFGKIGDFGSFDDQQHQIGPTVSGKLADMTFMFGYLKGVSKNARDDVFRFWLSTSF